MTISTTTTTKTDLNTRTQPLRWLAIRVRVYAVIQNRQFNLVFCTLLRPYDTGNRRLRGVVFTSMADRNRGGRRGLADPSHILGTAIRWENPPADAGSRTRLLRKQGGGCGRKNIVLS